MAEPIRLGGMNSGLDTEAIVEAMLTTYQTKIDNQNKKLTKLQESFFDAATVCDTANGKGLGDSTAVTCDNCTFVHLDSLSASLFDSVVNTNGITNIEAGSAFLKLLVCKSLDLSHWLLLDSENIRASIAEDCSVICADSRLVILSQ